MHFSGLAMLPRDFWNAVSSPSRCALIIPCALSRPSNLDQKPFWISWLRYLFCVRYSYIRFFMMVANTLYHTGCNVMSLKFEGSSVGPFLYIKIVASFFQQQVRGSFLDPTFFDDQVQHRTREWTSLQNYYRKPVEATRRSTWPTLVYDGSDLPVCRKNVFVWNHWIFEFWDPSRNLKCFQNAIPDDWSEVSPTSIDIERGKNRALKTMLLVQALSSCTIYV